MPSPKIQFAFPAASLAVALLLAACGGGPSGETGSSSGGEFAVLAGTFTKKGASLRPVPPATTGGDSVFGAVNSAGNGFLADFTSPAIFSFQSASNGGSIVGVNFAAYAGVGNTLDGSNTLQQGSVGGAVNKQGNGAVEANVTFSNSATPFSDTVTINLDNPQAKPVPFSTSAGTYKANYSSGTAISSTGFSNNTAAAFSITLNSDGSFDLSSSACSQSIAGTATVDNTYNVYTLTAQIPASSNCANNLATTLNGLAVYLPAGATSPLNGSTLTTPVLLVEMDDLKTHTDGPDVAVTLVASHT